MKKNYFKKIASVAAASAVLTAAMASATSVSAKAGDLGLVIPEITVPASSAGTDVAVTIAIRDDSKFSADSIGLTLEYDSKLTYKKSSSEYIQKSGVTHKEAAHTLLFAAGGCDDEEGDYGVGAGVDLITFTFTVPADAKAGDKYPITWVNDPKMNLFNTQDATYANTLIPYEYVDGYIAIEGVAETTPVTTVTTPVPTTTTIATTTTVVTTTTTVPATTTAPVTTTTTAPATTTTAPATTTAVTTTTTAATTTAVTTTTTAAKSTKATQKNSPNTGNTANGVAGLVATMVVAAGAAVALKKKKD